MSKIPSTWFMNDPYYGISYFGFNFDRKSTYVTQCAFIIECRVHNLIKFLVHDIAMLRGYSSEKHLQAGSNPIRENSLRLACVQKLHSTQIHFGKVSFYKLNLCFKPAIYTFLYKNLYIYILGRKNGEIITTPRNIKLKQDLDLKKISLARKCSALITENGDLYVSGANTGCVTDSTIQFHGTFKSKLFFKVKKNGKVVV